MTCREYKDEIQEFLDGELPDGRVEALRGHCMHCPDCARYLREMDALHRELVSLREEPVPELLHKRIMDAYRKEKRPSASAWLRRLNRYPFAAVAAVLVLLIGTVSAVGLLRGRELSLPARGAIYAADGDSEATEAPQELENKEQAVSGPLFAAKTTVAGASSAGASSASASSAEQTTQATEEQTALRAPAMLAGSEDKTSSPDLSAIRAEAKARIPQVRVQGGYAFVHVLRAETAPQAFTEWTAEDIEYDGEEVTVLFALVTRSRAEAVVQSADADWDFFCDNAEVWPVLSEKAEKGLLIVIVPRGA